MTDDWQVKSMSTLNLNGWLEFNRYKWDVRPIRVRLCEDGKELPAVEAVLYLDKKGRIVQPPLNPYLPVIFYPTTTNKDIHLHRQWMSVSRLLAKEFLRHGVKGSVSFSPEVLDIRQWQWQGFLSKVRYTFYLDLPYDREKMEHSASKLINKANDSGFTCELATKDSFGEIIECLLETEIRQKFNHRLTVRDLEMALELIGKENFRPYICRGSTGKIASARIVISAPGLEGFRVEIGQDYAGKIRSSRTIVRVPGSRAIDWIAGTKKDFLSSGSTQSLIWYALNDLAQRGVSGFDFVGANLPTISAAKADWGGKLMPYYAVRPIDIRTLGRLGQIIWQQTRGHK